MSSHMKNIADHTSFRRNNFSAWFNKLRLYDIVKSHLLPLSKDVVSLLWKPAVQEWNIRYLLSSKQNNSRFQRESGTLELLARFVYIFFRKIMVSLRRAVASHSPPDCGDQSFKSVRADKNPETRWFRDIYGAAGQIWTGYPVPWNLWFHGTLTTSELNPPFGRRMRSPV